MHSSQFGITFTDSRGPVNSDGPIHCIRSLNRMVRYSVMPVCDPAPLPPLLPHPTFVSSSQLAADFDFWWPGGIGLKEPPVLGGEESPMTTSSICVSFRLPFWSLMVLLSAFAPPHPSPTLPPHPTLLSTPQPPLVSVHDQPPEVLPSVPVLLVSPLSLDPFQSFETGDTVVASFVADDFTAEPRLLSVEPSSDFFEGVGAPQ